MSTKPGWAAWRKPVVCRPCRFASQRHKRTWLLCNNPLQQPPCGSYSHAATRDENPSQPHQAAALSAPELGSEPRSAAACRSELDEAGCANREVPGRCRLTPHGAAEQGWGGQSWDRHGRRALPVPAGERGEGQLVPRRR